MPNYDGYVRIGTKISTKEASTQMATLENQMLKSAQRVDSLRAKLEQLGGEKTKTDAYKELEKDLAAANREAEKLGNAVAKLSDKGTFSQQFQDMNSQYMEARQYADELEMKMNQLVAEGKAFTIGSDTGEYRKAADDLTIAQNQLSILNQKHDELIAKENAAASGMNRMGVEGSKSFSKINAGAGKANKSFKKTQYSLGRIIKMMIMFNLVFSVINAATTAIGNMISADSDLSSSLAQIKGNLLTAFAPIYYYILPAIKALLNFIARLTANLAYLVSAIFGKTIDQSQKMAAGIASAASATKDSTKATKDAKKAQADFDELHVISKNDSSSGSSESSGGIAPAFNLSDQNKPEWVTWVADHMKEILTLVEAIGAAIAGWKIASLFTGDLKTLAGIAMTCAGAVFFLKGAFDAWENGMDSGNLLEMLGGAALIIGGLAIAFGPLGAAIGSIVTGIGLLVVGIHDMITNGINWQNTIAVMSGIGLTLFGVLTSVAGVAGGVAAAIGLAGAAIAGVVIAIINDWDNIKKSVFDAWSTAIENIKAAFSGALDFFKSAGGHFSEFWSKLWNGDIIGAFEEFGYGVKDVMSGIVEFFKGIINTIIGFLNIVISAVVSVNHAVAKLFNAMSITIPDWIPGIGGKTWSPNIPVYPETKIPYLAEGAVIPGGHEFMAMLGDQPSGQTNIETPLSTMVQAFKQAMAETGGGSQNITVQAVLDGEVIYSNVVRTNNQKIRQTGRNALAY